MRDLAVAHAEAGHISALAAFAPAQLAFEPELERLRRVGASIYLPENTLRGFARLRFYASAIRQFQPDVIFAHATIPALWGRLAAIRLGSQVPFVSVLHSGSDDFAGAKLRWAERLLKWRADLTVAVSSSAADNYARWMGKAPLRVINNGVDLVPYTAAASRRPEVRRSLGIEPSEKLVVQVGRICRVKGQITTLAALSDLLRSDRSIKVWFAGIDEDAEYLQSLRRSISAEGLARQVKYLGPRSDVPELLAAADLYMMPSLSEAHSIAFLEALASGVSVVASRIPSFEFASGLPGVRLVELGDAAGLSAAAADLLRHPGRFMRELSDYDLRRSAAQYLEVASDLT